MRCIRCNEEFEAKRARAGYNLCKDCGDEYASELIEARSKETAPLYNKGPYMLIPRMRGATKSLGKKGESK